MKVKYSLIPFIPIALAMAGLKIMSLFGLDSDGLFLGMNKVNITYAVIGLALALFVICVIFNILDRKTAPVYAVKKNPVAGILSVLSRIAVAGYSFFSLMNTQSDSEYYMMSVICALIAVPAGIAFILMSKVHFVGNASASGISVLFVFPSLWGCAELVYEFLNATRASISSSDMTALFCYIFLTLYFFSHSMIVSRVKGRNPVKACFIYGLPSAALSLTYGIYVLLTAFIENSGITQIIFSAELVILALYTISFITEMFFNTLTKDEVEIIDGMPDEDDTYENSYVKSGGYDELVFSETVGVTAPKSVLEKEENSYISNVDALNDFIIGYKSEAEDEPIPYLTKNEMKNAGNADSAYVNAKDIKDDEKTAVKTKKADGNLQEKSPKSPSGAMNESKPKAGQGKAKPVLQNDDELESILSEVQSKRRSAENQSSTDAGADKPAGTEAKKAENTDKSDIERLLEELENKK